MKCYELLKIGNTPFLSPYEDKEKFFYMLKQSADAFPIKNYGDTFGVQINSNGEIQTGGIAQTFNFDGRRFHIYMETVYDWLELSEYLKEH